MLKKKKMKWNYKLRVSLGLSALFLTVSLAGCGEISQQAQENRSPVDAMVSENEAVAADNDISGGEEQQNYSAPEILTGYEEPVVLENAPRIEADNAAAEEQAQNLTQQSNPPEQLLDQTSAALLMAQQAGKYCYEQLSDREQFLYVEILSILQNHGEDSAVSTNNPDILQRVFQCVYNDHPEIFWIDGYSYTRHMQGDEVSYLTFRGNYIYTEQECLDFREGIDLYMYTFLSGIDSNASAYEKVKYAYDYLILHTDYRLDARDNQNILSVFLYGESVCQGYAKAMQYMLEQLNVPCTIVVGTVHTGEGHAWNLVQIDGQYYYVDATWGDASYIVDGASTVDARVPVNYEFLNVTTQELLKTHTIHHVVALPECTSVEANYFYMENRYLTGYDEALLEQIFREAYENGEVAVTLKCSDAEVYQMVCEELINRQSIFRFLQGDLSSVIYSLSDEECTLCFWL
ncbi:MAG: transglutaminase domain-containing protein [Lachnospiraceae bacterium]